MGYGSANDVAAMATMWTSNGVFTNTTRPTIEQVEGWLDQVSSLADVSLKRAGFTQTPVTEATTVNALAFLVNGLVVDLVHASHSTGRFFADRNIKNGTNTRALIIHDIDQWVSENVDGLIEVGLEFNAISEGIGFKDTNEAGEELFPIFQREAFDNAFDNWDTE